jgi:hypothetical protein
MPQLPPRHEPRSLVRSAIRRIPAVEAYWDFLAAPFGDTDLNTVAMLSAIGCLIALNLVLRFPDFAAVVAQSFQP